MKVVVVDDCVLKKFIDWLSSLLECKIYDSDTPIDIPGSLTGDVLIISDSFSEFPELISGIVKSGLKMLCTTAAPVRSEEKATK